MIRYDEIKYYWAKAEEHDEKEQKTQIELSCVRSRHDWRVCSSSNRKFT